MVCQMKCCMARRSGKISTFMDTIFNFCATSLFFGWQNFFNQFNIYLYAIETHFCKRGFLFCATLNTFNQRESSFGCHIIFFVATTYFFVAHIILLRNVNFYLKYFFVDTTVLCATQDFFVLPNVSIKNIVNN